MGGRASSGPTSSPPPSQFFPAREKGKRENYYRIWGEPFSCSVFPLHPVTATFAFVTPRYILCTLCCCMMLARRSSFSYKELFGIDNDNFIKSRFFSHHKSRGSDCLPFESSGFSWSTWDYGRNKLMGRKRLQQTAIAEAAQ